jgi:hypothetical protein
VTIIVLPSTNLWAFARQDRESGILLRDEVLIDLPPPMAVGQPSAGNATCRHSCRLVGQNRPQDCAMSVK